jgi:hypothetical protein
VDLNFDATRSPSPREAPDPTNGSPEPIVAILLSTFNGERYLHDQLNSYSAQTHGNWRLYWRDDGSTDGSSAVVHAFAKGAGEGQCRHAPETGQLRATGSFLALLHTALREDASCFAFSDQDDVWLPDKLAHAVASLADVPIGLPALYFCERTLVDAELRPIGRAPALRRPPGFPASLTQNVIPGCCMMLNRAAAELIDSTEAPERTWHDWWCYIVVSAGEGRVIRGDSPDILYRQHAGNLVGEPLTFWRRAVAALRRGRGPFISLFWRHVVALQARPALLPVRTRKILAKIAKASRAGLIARARILFIPGLVRQTWWETLVFRLWFLLG